MAKTVEKYVAMGAASTLTAIAKVDSLATRYIDDMIEAVSFAVLVDFCSMTSRDAYRSMRRKAALIYISALKSSWQC